MTLIKELKSATKIGPIYFSDILFVAVYWIMLFFLRNHVATSLRIVYFIFNFAVAVILVMPSILFAQELCSLVNGKNISLTHTQ